MSVWQILIAAVVAAILSVVMGYLAEHLTAYIARRRSYEPRPAVLSDKTNLFDLIAFWLCIYAGALGACLYVPAPLPLIYVLTTEFLLVSISLMDVKYRIIPNELVVDLLILSFLMLLIDSISTAGIDWKHIGSAFLGFFAAFIVFELPKLLKKNPGGGDVKLGMVMGFALGTINLMYAIILMGFGCVAFLMLRARFRVSTIFGRMIPMGPAMSIGYLAVLILSYTSLFE